MKIENLVRSNGLFGEIEGNYIQFHFTELENGYITSNICSEKESLYQIYH